MPVEIDLGKEVAIDVEAMGLKPERDRLCVVQLSSGNSEAHLIQFTKNDYHAPNLCRLLNNPNILKLFHYARFDIAVIQAYLGVVTTPVYCTKIASKIVRTYTNRHSLKDLCRDLLGIELSKQKQSSDWGKNDLTQEQIAYAASDVLHLHKIKYHLDEMLVREDRIKIAQDAFYFLNTRAHLDLIGFSEEDIFAH
ncbi:ribonuclease D [Candidatus Endolissoclinum faulkneri L5]|uniref:Ribonuclease D n=1 Tax=Candidatus Endolissoclinum faulkneri L5 TaxID=1401328 RepID=V9TTS3_9PROT|nr:ribonuclease H-like domain-containing protein [Candidatus Endolissoclinum faulkneri]AHC74006.1 ribonuclease D [Candidatus Endolissoclinum faulkneri L5]